MCSLTVLGSSLYEVLYVETSLPIVFLHNTGVERTRRRGGVPGHGCQDRAEHKLRKHDQRAHLPL